MSGRLKSDLWAYFHGGMIGLAGLMLIGSALAIGQSYVNSQAQVDHYRLEDVEKRLDTSLTGLEGVQHAISDFDKRLALMEQDVKSLTSMDFWHQLTPIGVASLIAKEAFYAIKKRKPNEEPQD